MISSCFRRQVRSQLLLYWMLTLWMKCVRWTALPVIQYYVRPKGSDRFPAALPQPSLRPTVRASNPESSGLNLLHAFRLIWRVSWNETRWQQLVYGEVVSGGDKENQYLLRCDIVCSGRQVPTFRIYFWTAHCASIKLKMQQLRLCWNLQ